MFLIVEKKSKIFAHLYNFVLKYWFVKDKKF